MSYRVAPYESKNANKARLHNRWGCSVGHTLRNFNPPSRLDAHPRPSGASALTLAHKSMPNQNTTPLTRIAVFYDGNYYMKLSNYYKHQHHRKQHLAFTGVHEFIRHKVAEKEYRDVAFCQIVESHFFRGRFSLNAALARDRLVTDRFIDQLLMFAGIVTHYYPMNEYTDPPQEKGIDVWLSLEAYDLAVHKRFDVLVLIAGDEDFVPLIRKLNGIGTPVMLLGIDVNWDENGTGKRITVSQALLDEASYPVILNTEIDAKPTKGSPIIEGLFVPKDKDKDEDKR